MIVAARTRVLLGHEVEDGSDKWTPPSSDTGARDHAVSRCGEEGRRAAAGLALSGPDAGAGLLRERKEGGGENRPRGRERSGPSPRQGGGEMSLFHFLNSSFAQIF